MAMFGDKVRVRAMWVLRKIYESLDVTLRIFSYFLGRKIYEQKTQDVVEILQLISIIYLCFYFFKINEL